MFLRKWRFGKKVVSVLVAALAMALWMGCSESRKAATRSAEDSPQAKTVNFENGLDLAAIPLGPDIKLKKVVKWWLENPDTTKRRTEPCVAKPGNCLASFVIISRVAGGKTKEEVVATTQVFQPDGRVEETRLTGERARNYWQKTAGREGTETGVSR